jgi:CDP-diacylglycerol--serine O-phosphatidyltransferase
VLLLGALHWAGKLTPGDGSNEKVWLGAWEVAGMMLHPLTLIYALSGSAMISTIRVPKI